MNAAGRPHDPELEAFLSRARLLGRDAFQKTHPGPFLIQMSGVAPQKKTSGFRTIVPEDDFTPARVEERVVALFEVRKKPGANAFAFMITIGRTPNNDVVVPHGSVSKFHASLRQDPQGTWLITDKSTNGTWVDGERLPSDQPRALRENARVQLSRSVVFRFATAAAVWDDVVSTA